MDKGPRAIPSLIALAAAWFVSEGIYRLMSFGSCSIPAGPGETPCPPGSEQHFFYVFGGMVVAMATMFLGGSWFSFLALFVGVGIGGIRAGLDSEVSWGVWFGLAFLVGPVLIVLSVVLVGVRRLREARLMSSGEQGTGTVVAVEDTGFVVNGSPRLRIRLRIEPANGVTPPFETTRTANVSRLNVPRVGDRYAVWFDPDDHDKWTFTQTAAAAAAQQPPLRKLVELAKRGAGPAVPPPGTG
jgi:hypothetical protein